MELVLRVAVTREMGWFRMLYSASPSRLSLFLESPDGLDMEVEVEDGRGGVGCACGVGLKPFSQGDAG